MSAPGARRLPTLSELGAATMTPEALADLAHALRRLASDADELRLIRLERLRLILAQVPNRPALGHYRRSRMTPAEVSRPPG